MSAEWVLTIGAGWGLSLVWVARACFVLGRVAQQQDSEVAGVLRACDVDREAQAAMDEVAA